MLLLLANLGNQGNMDRLLGGRGTVVWDEDESLVDAAGTPNPRGIELAAMAKRFREIGPALTKELVMTCRPFDAHEAKAAGFVNRVVPEASLDLEVDALVQQLLAKPKLALLETKAHVNAVTESMVGTGRSWADADGLYAGLRDAEGRASAAAYMERVRRR